MQGARLWNRSPAAVRQAAQSKEFPLTTLPHTKDIEPLRDWPGSRAVGNAGEPLRTLGGADAAAAAEIGE
ncbi:hypothetical protein GEOBRER4_n2176 [Citrifermentans bremense]|uniref:Uncharacterized protein n=1 Tax=Citrifermentans bremense TaxID=60035 RepID=A0A7R7IYB0_9BACT|nr:hypothetical protein GEOBRER4_n2176 [Citrifermentans bremense]